MSSDARKTLAPILVVAGSVVAAPFVLHQEERPSADRVLITSTILDLKKKKLDRPDIHCSQHFENCYVATMNAKCLAALDGVTIETALNDLSQMNGCFNYNNHRKVTMESISPAAAYLLADSHDDNEFTMETEDGPVAVDPHENVDNIVGFFRMTNELAQILDFTLPEVGLTDDVIDLLERRKQQEESGHWVASNE